MVGVRHYLIHLGGPTYQPHWFRDVCMRLSLKQEIALLPLSSIWIKSWIALFPPLFHMDKKLTRHSYELANSAFLKEALVFDPSFLDGYLSSTCWFNTDPKIWDLIWWRHDIRTLSSSYYPSCLWWSPAIQLTNPPAMMPPTLTLPT